MLLQVLDPAAGVCLMLTLCSLKCSAWFVPSFFGGGEGIHVEFLLCLSYMSYIWYVYNVFVYIYVHTLYV